MKAKDIMSTPPIVVTREATPKAAIELLVKHKINALPVVSQTGELVGMVSEGDLIGLEATPDPRSSVIPFTPPPGPKRVQDVMTREVIAVPESADVRWVASLMHEHGVKSMPVVSGERVVGVVARRDLLRVFIRPDEEIRAEVQSLLDEEIVALGRFRAEVRNGDVTLIGAADKRFRRLAAGLVRSVEGVIDVKYEW